ncbi:MAG TPA: FAD-dependent oxidoreductase [Alphaproteobacteria bacterium]|nr:FAD-dependent oxidoreductase [Alphaproteobacteria bacterium]
MERLTVDICVIGGGSAGLSVAAGASQLGASVVLCERHKMGGDCLNFGCVPSKSVIAAAEHAESMRRSRLFGVGGAAPIVDYRTLRDHVRGVIAAIAPTDSVERFTGLGVQVIDASARFVAADEIEAGGTRVRARRFVIATGSSPAVPPIPGLNAAPYLTNETVFDLDERPRHLIVIGGGPIGCELAQAHRRLGAEVTVLEMARIMPKDDPELVDFVRQRLVSDGVALVEGARVTAIERAGDDITAVIETDEGQRRIIGSHLLLAAGRRPNLSDLDLAAAGVKHSATGVEVDARLRTSNPRIFAIGDASGGPQFTHMANYHAGIVIRNALFRWPAKVDGRAIPWVTFTEPELAQVGLTEEAARQRHGDGLRILRWPFHENDRAQAQRAVEGLIKVVATRRGKVLGAGIVGAHAGELILPWGLACLGKVKLSDLASMIAPYPTLSEVSKRAAGSYFTPKLFSPRTRAVVRFLARFG